MLNPPHPIMIVDDIETNLLFLKTKLGKLGFNNFICCQDSRQVYDLLTRYDVEILMLDLKMPHIDGQELLPVIKEHFSDLPVVVVTDVNEVKTAVNCMQQGAFDYITKPIQKELFNATISRALSFRTLKRENDALRKYVPKMEDLKQPEAFSEMITVDRQMINIFKYIESVAKTSEPVLITGETGVGKELIARAIHRVSGLEGELVSVNIAGLDDNVFSDTLFGHVKGAYTGAEKPRIGLIEKASRGTLFLDEIGDLAFGSQVKLLRLLQEGEYLTLGTDFVKHSNARVLVATNRNVWDLQNQGQFRKDLIFRLRTHHIDVPSLSKRKDDIPLLLNHFVEQSAKKLGTGNIIIPNEIVRFLKRYRFPGNIRELKAMVFDAVSRASHGTLSLDAFRAYCHPDYFIDEKKLRENEDAAQCPLQRFENSTTLPDAIIFPSTLPTIKEMTQMLVDESMRRANGNQTIAAKMIGISQPALNKRLKKDKPENKSDS